MNKFSIGEEKHPLFAEPILVARFKSCECHLAIFGNELNIQFIKSDIEGRGHATEMVKKLLRYAKDNGLALVSSTAISGYWSRICDKFKIKIYE